MLRHQLPVHSPLTAGDVARAARARLVGGGDPGQELAALLRETFDAPSVALYGSGTQALQVALETAVRRVAGTRSDPSGAAEAREASVALPAFSCYDVVTAAVGAGVRMTFYDVDPDTLGPDLDSLERTLAAGASVVVVAPLYGMPLAWDEVEALASRHDVLLIEDAAQAAGARWKRRRVGALGPLSVLSFGRGKGWTGGGGGALLDRTEGDGERPTERPEPGAAAAGRAPGVRLLARALAQAVLGRPSLYGLPASLPWLHLGETHYRPPEAPRPMHRAAAALALQTRRRLERERAERRTNARWYLDRLDDSRVVVPRLPSGADPGFLRLPVRAPDLPSSLPRALRRAGVARSYPKVLPELPAVRSRAGDVGSDRFPGARALASELLTLPTHSRLARRDREAVLDTLI